MAQKHLSVYINSERLDASLAQQAGDTCIGKTVNWFQGIGPFIFAKADYRLCISQFSAKPL